MRKKTFFWLAFPFLFYNMMQDFYVVKTLELSPIATFASACAKCHGAEGDAYGEKFATLNEAEMKKIVRAMMENQSSLKPTSVEVDAMTAYNLALAANAPFAVLTGATSINETKIFVGETSTNSEVFLLSDNTETPVKVNSAGFFSFKMSDNQPFRLKLVKAGKTATLQPEVAQWTRF